MRLNFLDAARKLLESGFYDSFFGYRDNDEIWHIVRRYARLLDAHIFKSKHNRPALRYTYARYRFRKIEARHGLEAARKYWKRQIELGVVNPRKHTAQKPGINPKWIERNP